MWWCQLNDLLKVETHPSSLLNFGTANTNEINLFLMTFPYMSLHFKLVPVLYQKGLRKHYEETQKSLLRVFEGQ